MSNYTIELQPFILYIYFNLCKIDIVDQTYSHINIVYFYLCIYESIILIHHALRFISLSFFV